MEIAWFWHHQLVADVLGSLGEEQLLLFLVQFLVEISADRQLRLTAREARPASQIGHPNPPEKMLEGELKKAPKRKTRDFTPESGW
jgi:hypothetical protein